MKIKKSYLLFILIIILFSLQAISAEDNTTISDEIINTDDIDNTIHEADETNVLKDEPTNVIIEAQKVSSPYQVGEFTFKITNKTTGTALENRPITFIVHIKDKDRSVNFNKKVKTDTNGIATFYLNETVDKYGANYKYMKIGTYTLQVKDDNTQTTQNFNVTIEKATVEVITYGPYTYKEKTPANFTMQAISNGKGIGGAVFSIYLKNEKSDLPNTTTTNSDGYSNFPVTLNAIGMYTLVIETNDENLNYYIKETRLEVEKLKANIKIESIIKYYNSGDTVVFKVTDMNGNPISGMQVQMLIDGISYVRIPDKNGRIKFSTSLKVGKHKITINIGGGTYQGTTSKTFTVKKAEGKLTSSSNKIYYNSGKSLKIKLTNKKTKKHIFNAKIHFNVKRSAKIISDYYGTTGPDGTIKFNVTLNSGTYKVKVSGDDTKNFKTKTIIAKLVVKKAPVKITAKKSSKKIEFKITNKKTKNPVKTKLKIKVYTGKKYKTYVSKSNSKGLIKIKAKSGSHKVIATLANNNYSSKTFRKTIKI